MIRNEKLGFIEGLYLKTPLFKNTFGYFLRTYTFAENYEFISRLYLRKFKEI